MLLLRVGGLILLFEINDEGLEGFQFLGSEREHLACEAVARGVEGGALLPSSVRGPVDFWAFRRLARSWASDGARRMVVGGLGGASAGRDGSLASGFFLVGMDGPSRL